MTGREDEVPEGLSRFQLDVARAFFALPEARNFLLAGGAALLALRLIDRLTGDLDLFTSDATVYHARRALNDAASARRWTVDIVSESRQFARLVVTDDSGQRVLVDLGVDAAPRRPPGLSALGPVFDPEELAGQKVLALFGRAEARDFADVHALASQYGTALLLQRAGELDAGFDHAILADMMGTLDRFDNDELPTDDADNLRGFFRSWADELRTSPQRR